MHILLTGATGYIGKRLLSVLLNQGHFVTAVVRDKNRLQIQDAYRDHLSIVEYDFNKPCEGVELPSTIDVAFYLLHSMSSNNDQDFEELEKITAIHFLELVKPVASLKQIVYLSGIVNENGLSKHLRSRKNVQDILEGGIVPLTVLSAGIIVGSGSSSFEMVRDLCEKLPVMVCPKWVNTKTQPIAVKNVMQCLTGVMLNEATFGKQYDIGGPEVLSYKEMMLIYGAVRGLSPKILIVPVLTPRLSSYWLYFVTATNYKLARSLVSSMTCETVCKDNRLFELLKIEAITYRKAIEDAFEKIEQNMVISSWKDSFISSNPDRNILNYINVPTFGVFTDRRAFKVESHESSLNKIWSIGGRTGWYYGTWLWKLRGYVDKVFGGVGLRRGRTNPNVINIGDALDFWRVILADKQNSRLILYAEMKLPGEAWLELKIENDTYVQVATFRPKGLLGRLYWFVLLPFHAIIFQKMAKIIAAK